MFLRLGGSVNWPEAQQIPETVELSGRARRMPTFPGPAHRGRITLVEHAFAEDESLTYP